MKIVHGLIVLFSFLCCGSTLAGDGFQDLKCGSEIRKTLLGRFMPNEEVSAIEARHKELGLKDLGGTEIGERLFLTSWQICGNEYLLLQDRFSIVHDVLQVPPHSADSPEFIGSCEIKEKAYPDVVMAILNNKEGANFLAASAAWKINLKKMRFDKTSTAGLQCPRLGIITADGGE